MCMMPMSVQRPTVLNTPSRNIILHRTVSSAHSKPYFADNLYRVLAELLLLHDNTCAEVECYA